MYNDVDHSLTYSFLVIRNYFFYSYRLVKSMAHQQKDYFVATGIYVLQEHLMTEANVYYILIKGKNRLSNSVSSVGTFILALRNNKCITKMRSLNIKILMWLYCCVEVLWVIYIFDFHFHCGFQISMGGNKHIPFGFKKSINVALKQNKLTLPSQWTILCVDRRKVLFLKEIKH